MISFIVSGCDHPLNLYCCLASLQAQMGEPEIILCDNGLPAESVYPNARRVYTGAAGARNCYESANMVFGDATRDWLCFPSDDSMYVSRFSEIMLGTAMKTGADLIYCDCIYRQGSIKGGWAAYSVLECSPRAGRIDKTNFIVRRSLFQGFPEHPQNYRDGALIDQLVRQGVKHAKAPGVLVVHQ